MKSNDQNYFISVGGQRISVSREVYEAYYRPVWRTHYHAGKHGSCGCSDWRRCNGDCGLCRYQTAGELLSLDKETEDNGDICPDPDAGFEDILFDKCLKRELLQALSELDPESRNLCELIMFGKTEREMAEQFQVPQTTLNYRKKKLMAKLRRRLEDFI